MTTPASPPPIIRSAWVNRPSDEAFAVFTDEIGAWWPLPTHGLFGDRSAGVMFRDGRLVEQSIEGAEVTWGEVLVWEPGERLVFSWHPGRESAVASEVEVAFESEGAGTRVVLHHRGWEAFGTAALEQRLSYVGPNAWGYVLDHFGDGAEVRLDAVDTTALEAAYERFFAEADQGGFGHAAAGQWNAEEVVAHVALNDAAMLAVGQALVHQNVARFENDVCQNPDVLRNFIDVSGGMSGLVERGRHLSRLVVAMLWRLSPEQRETEVHCCLRHDGEIMVDRPVAWEEVAVTTHAAMHLPAHTEQLANLRP